MWQQQRQTGEHSLKVIVDILCHSSGLYNLSIIIIITQIVA